MELENMDAAFKLLVVPGNLFLLARRSLRALLIAATLLIPVHAATLANQTLKAWQDYIQKTVEKTQDRTKPGKNFLCMDESQDLAARVQAGEIVVSPGDPAMPKVVTGGLIHDWIGTVFLPNATVEQILPVLRDYARYKDFYRPAVTDSRPVALSDAEDRFSMRMVNKSFFRTNALDSEFKSEQFRVDERRFYTISQTTCIREVAQYGSSREHTLPEDEGTGLIWRLFSITRFEERDGGVYIELEALALSRDIPASLHWLVDPIVRRVARASLAKSLQQTRVAVTSNASYSNRTMANTR